MTEYDALLIALNELNAILSQLEYGPRYVEINAVCDCLLKLLIKIEH
jgi:hypothetical protein